MSFGKLYGSPDNARTVGLLAIAKENKLDIELVETQPRTTTDDYQKINKLGKIPSFVGSDGFILSEVIAIAVYFTSQNEKTSLLGKTKQDYAAILRWLSFGNMEILGLMPAALLPLLGRMPYNKKSVEEAQTKLNDNAKVLEDHLLVNTYLVGERLTLADVMVAALSYRAFVYLWDKAWRAEHPNLTRWFTTVTNQPILQNSRQDWPQVETAIKNQAPPKPKEDKPKEQKKEKPKAQAQAADEEDEPKEEPKAKHPLEALGRPTLAIDEWKRKYKNEETREVALPWFWQNMNFEEYSIYAVDFLYNEELTMTFMSNNQIGGFFNRLEASRKYLMGCASVYGVANDSVIKGAFLVRGQDALPAFDVAPDYESYKLTKLDPKSEKDKEYVDSMWAWDKPVEVSGKKYEWADGKIFV